MLIALVVAVWLGVFVFLYHTEDKTAPIHSPDGKYVAYLGIRGFMDTIRTHFYVKDLHTRATTSRTVCYTNGGIKWSPGSKRVAAVNHSNDGRPGCLYIYDVKTKQWYSKETYGGLGFAEKSNPTKLNWNWTNDEIIAITADSQPNTTVLWRVIKGKRALRVEIQKCSNR